MPTKTATSHAAAVLVCTVASAFLIEATRPTLSGLTRLVGRGSTWLIDLFGISLRRDTLTIILLACLLAFVWGLAYHRLRASRAR
jgi:hypothetical protein